MAPSATHVADAVAHAAAHRRTVRGAYPRFAHVSAGALEERVVGLPGRPEPAAGGWWRVGLVDDELTGDELRVWLHPASGRVRTQRPAPFTPPPPPRPRPGLSFDPSRPWPAALPGWVHGVAGRAHCAGCASAALRGGLDFGAVRSTPVVPGRPGRCVGCGSPIE